MLEVKQSRLYRKAPSAAHTLPPNDRMGGRLCTTKVRKHGITTPPGRTELGVKY